MPASPTHTSTEVEIITLGRIYVQTAYLLPLWIFKICDLRNALKTVFSSRHTCMVRLLIVLVPLCLSLVFLGFFCRCFEEPYVVFGDVHPAESTCRFYWALLASILLSVLYVHSVQCIGKLQAKFQLVIFFFFCVSLCNKDVSFDIVYPFLLWIWETSQKWCWLQKESKIEHI